MREGRDFFYLYVSISEYPSVDLFICARPPGQMKNDSDKKFGTYTLHLKNVKYKRGFRIFSKK